MRHTELNTSIVFFSSLHSRKTAHINFISNLFQPVLRSLKTLLFSYLFITGTALADGSISGNITDSDTLAPIPTMLVCLFDSNANGAGCVQSDVNGDYTTPVVADGAYTALAVVGHSMYIQEFYGGIYHFEDYPTPDTVEVAGGNVAGIDFQLEKGPTIEGTITDRDGGAPLQNVKVSVHRSDGTWTHICSRTAADGHYRTSGFPVAGTDFIVKANSESHGYLEVYYPDNACIDYYCNPADADTFNVGPASVFGIDFELEAFANVSGKIVDDADGVTAVHPVAISLVHPETGEIFDASGTAHNNPDGTYSFTNIAPGEYKLFFNAYGAANNYVDELYSNISCPDGNCDINGLGSTKEFFSGANDFNEELVSGALLSGTIVDAADGTTPVHPVYISFIDPVSGADVGGGTNNPDGTYIIGAVDPGEYKFFFNAINEANHYTDELYDEVTPCDNGGCDFVGLGNTLVLVAGDNNLDEELAVPPTISGTVSAEVGGDKLEGIQVCVSRKSDEVRLTCNNTDANGFYELTIDEPRDDLVVWTRRVNDQPYFPEVYADQPCCDISAGTSIDVTGGDQVVDFELTRSASISGVISSSVGDGSLPNGQGRARLYSAIDGVQVAVAFASSDGSYTLSGFTPGTYHLLLTGYGDNLIDELYDGSNGIYCPQLSCDTTSGTEFVFSGTEDFSNIDAVLDPGSQFSGHVSKDGVPLDSIFINFYSETGKYAGFGRTSNDGSGNYVTNAGYPAGNYYATNRWIINGTESGNEDYLPVAYPNRLCGAPCDPTIGDILVADGSTTVPNIDFDFVDYGGSISGNITGSDTALAIQNIQLWLFDTQCSFVAASESDVNGDYKITVPNAGSYYLFAIANDTTFINLQTIYMNQQYPGINMFDSCWPELNDVTQGDAILVAELEQVSGKDFILEPGGTIRGSISDSNGVLANNTAGARLYGLDGTQHIVARNKEGDDSYRIGGILPGTYHVVLAGYNQALIDERYDDVKCPRNSCASNLGATFEIVTGTEDFSGVDALLDTGSVISGNVQIDSVPLEGAFLYFYNAAGDFAGFGSTAGDGNYQSISGFPAGSYYVALETEGYVKTVYPNRPCGDPCDATLGDPVVVDGTNGVGGIDFNSYAGSADTAVIYGSVVADDGGAPLDDIKICVVNKSDPDIDACMVTGATGSYLIGGLPKMGDYVVYTRDVGGKPFFGEVHDSLDCCDTSVGTSIDLTSSDAMANFSLATSGRIHGIVTDSVTGEGIPYVEMFLYDTDGNQINNIVSETSDDQAYLGQYAFSGVPDGTFYVFAKSEWQGYANELYPDLKRFRVWNYGPISDGQAIVIQNGTLVDGIDFELDPAGSINGIVSDSNGVLPFNKAHIRLYNRGDRTHLFSVGNWNDDGSYTIPGVPPGIYDVVLSSRRTTLVGERFDDIACPRNSCDLGLGTPVVVGPQEDVFEIDAVLEEGAQVAGIVTEAGTVEGVASFCIAFYTAEGIYATIGCTDQDGNYVTSTGLPPGEYRAANQFFTDEIDDGWLPQVWTDDGSFVDCGVPCNYLAGDTFTITGTTASTAVNLAMQQGSTISGNVQFGGGNLAGVEITLLDDTAQLARSATTDDSGNFLFEGIGSGNYYVRSLNDLGYLDKLHAEPDDVTCSPDCDPFSGTLLAIDGSSDYPGIDFVLITAGSISGTVTDESDDPVSGVSVEVLNNLGSLAGSALTDIAGEYEIGGLGNNNYYVRTRNQLGYRNGLYDGLACLGECNVTAGAGVAVTLGSNTGGVDFKLDGGAGFTGTVSQNGSSAWGGTVEVYAGNGDLVATGVVSSGNYTIDGLSPGDYWLVSRQPSAPDTAADGTPCYASCNPLTKPAQSIGIGELKTVNFSSQSSEIYVNVSDPLGSVWNAQNVTVIAYDLNGVEISRGAVERSYERARLLGMSAGAQVFLRTENDKGYLDTVFDGVECIGDCNVTQGTKVTAPVLSGDPRPTFLLQGGGSISGHVYQEGSSPPIPIPGVTIRMGGSNNTGGRVVTDSNGFFRFDGLRDATYNLTSEGDVDFIHEVLGGDACSPTRCNAFYGEQIVVSGDAITGKDFYLSPAAYKMTGYANDANGTAIPNGGVRIYDSAGDFLARQDMNGDGTFTIYGLAVGTYYLVFDSEAIYNCKTSIGGRRTCTSTPLVQTLYQGIACPGLNCDVTTGTPVVLSGPGGGFGLSADGSGNGNGGAGSDDVQIFNVSIEVESGYNIRGSVKDITDTPVAFEPVYIFDAVGKAVTEAITDNLGEFVTAVALPAGTYFAATSRAARVDDTPEQAIDAEDGIGHGLQDEIWNGFSCDGICAPSQGSGIGTAIVITSSDVNNIDFVLTRAPGIEVEKLTNGVDADTPNGGEAPEIAAGETVSWTYEVTNTGGEELVNIVVVDDQDVVVTCPFATLASDVSMTCTGSEPAIDLSQDPFTGVIGNCAGTPDMRLYQNTAIVTAQTGGGADVDDNDSSHYCNPVPAEELIFKNGFE